MKSQRPLELSPKQALVLDFMRKFHAENDQLPPCHFIADHFGVANNAAYELIATLEKKGAIERNVLGCKYRFARRSV